VDYIFLKRAPPATWKCTAMEEKVEIVEWATRKLLHIIVVQVLFTKNQTTGSKES
jgi:hypothetical protein